MRLTDADVDQWFAELLETMPTEPVDRQRFTRHACDMVDALACEARNPGYVFEAAEAAFPHSDQVPGIRFDRRPPPDRRA
jgi:hypothetical protein